MQPVPATIGDMPILYWTPIDSRHRVTGACKHFDLSTNSKDPVPRAIAIVSGGGSNFYLIRRTEDWQFITDTWHESLDDAFGQAEFEYEGVTFTWQAVGT